MMKKVFTPLRIRLLAMLLTVVFLYLASPFSAYTVVESENLIEEQHNQTKVEQSSEIALEESPKEIEELVTLREANVKHFKMTDGTYRAVSYANEVHRLNSDGVWEDIDNRLMNTDRNSESVYVSRDMRVSFSERLSADHPVFTLSENEKSISLTFVSDHLSTDDHVSLKSEEHVISGVEAVVTNSEHRRDDNRWKTFEEAVRINNTTRVLYSDVTDKVDIEYILDGDDVKENIIIKENAINYEYTFILDTDGMIAVLQKNGEILLLDSETREQCYVIPAPYMYDAKGGMSDSVRYDLKSIKNGYELKIVADPEWINEKERVFPVTIDPSIFTTNNGLEDTFIKSTSLNQNYASYINLWAGVDRIAFVKFDLPELPTGAELYYSMINLAYFHQYTSNSITIGAFQVLQDFDYNTVTWNITNAYANNGISTEQLGADLLMVSSQISSSTPGDAQFEITNAVATWYENPSTNYGIALRRVAGDIPYVMFRAKEAADGNQAYMTVAYTFVLEDGVYAIKSGYPGASFWMTLENRNVYAGAHLQYKQSESVPSATSVFDRSSLFKISHKEGSLYIIRSMLNNNLSFEIAGTTLIAKEIPSSDEEVPIEDTFVIEWTDHGFIICPVGRNACISLPSSLSSSNNLILGSKASLSPLTIWSFQKYTGYQRKEFSLQTPQSWTTTGFTVGNSYTASFSWYSTQIYKNGIRISVDSSCADLVDATWNNQTNKLNLIAKAPGRLTLNVYTKIASEVESLWKTYSYQVIPAEGAYYIQNVETCRYVDVEGPSTLPGATIQQWDYHTGNQEKWILEHAGDGYVRLKSAYSNLYMGVDSSDLVSVKQYSASNLYTEWRIDRSTLGNLLLICRGAEGDGMALSVPNGSGNGQNLSYVMQSDQDSVNDEWYLVSRVVSCVNYYDSTFAEDENRMNSIDNAIAFANHIYSKYYGIGLNMDEQGIKYLNILDSCATGATSLCTDAACGSNCYNDHHKNVSNISNQIFNAPRENDHVYIFWTERGYETYCKTKNGEHTPLASEPDKATSIVINNRPVIHFFEALGVSAQAQELCMSIVLTHELAHSFGMDDQYGTVGHSIINASCIMSGYDSTVAFSVRSNSIGGISGAYLGNVERSNGKNVFCDSCDDILRQLMSDVEFLGNGGESQ